MKKYLQVFVFTLKSQINFKVDYISSMFSFTIHILVFNMLWDYLLSGKVTLEYSKPELIWYIIVGELILYTTSKRYKQVSEMIKSGNILNMLTKPINFVLYIFAQESSCVIRFIVNIILGFILGIIMAPNINLTIPGIFMFNISIVISVITMILFEITIGLIAFITEENESFYLVFSKLILMCVFTPIDFFSDFVYKIFQMLPTTYIIYAPAKILIHYDINLSLTLIFRQLLSMMFFLICITILSKKGVRNINVNGG